MRRRPRAARASSALTWASSWSGSGRVSAGELIPTLFQVIEREVQLENVDPRLADHAEQPAPGVIGDERANPLRGQMPQPGNAVRLEIRRRRAGVRIEPARGSRHEVHGNG